MRSFFPMISLLIALAGCGFDQTQPAPVTDADAWGKLAPDAARPEQADSTAPAEATAAGTATIAGGKPG